MKLVIFSLVFVLTNYLVLSQQTISVFRLTPSADNTIYEDSTGNLSNGQGQDLRCGTNQIGEKRRTLVKFPISAIPPNSTIVSVQLTFEIAQSTPPIGNLTCHRATSDWGEGLSNAGIKGDSGTTPMANDATWIHKFYPNQLWNNAGGDFVLTPSDSQATGVLPYVTFDSQTLINDVQLFYDSAHLNFGWVIRGIENANNTVTPFYSNQFQPQLIPTLRVGFITTTSLNQVERKEQLSIFPNPTSNYLIIDEFDFLKNNAGYIIQNIEGKILKSNSLNSNKIDVSNLDNGTYLISIQSQNGFNQVFKFLKI